MPDEVVYPKFQSTLLQEERPSSLSLYLSYCLISIHAPTRGATIYHVTVNRGFPFQSTLLQEERRSSTVLFVSSFTISIHAPTRGATDGRPRWSDLFCISIHAPTRGATMNFATESFNASDFNPRSYKRSDVFRMVWSS